MNARQGQSLRERALIGGAGASVLALLFAVAGCAPAPEPPTAPTRETVATPEASERAGRPHPAASRSDLPDSAPRAQEAQAFVLQSPNGVEATAPIPVVAADGLHAETRTWRFAGRTGRAWHVYSPLPGRVAVRAARTPVDFDVLLPDDEAGSWVAVNGGFYDTGGDPMGVVISDGVVVNPHTGRGGSGILEVIGGVPRIVHSSDHDPSSTHAVQSIDRIVDGGRSLVTPRDDAPLAARTAVVISDDRIELVVLAERDSIVGDGNDVHLTLTSGRGLPLWAFAEYLVLTCDASEALNLDGAVSTQLAARIGDESIRVRGVLGTPNAVVLHGAGDAGAPSVP